MSAVLPRRLLSSFAPWALVALVASPAAAQSVPNTCLVGGVGLTCTVDDDCAGNDLATLCAPDPVEMGMAQTKSCQIPCGTGDNGLGLANDDLCAVGEKCSPTGNSRHFCKQVPFTVDINILDSCIFHAVQGLTPTLTDPDQETCSLALHLNRLLDQDGDLDYDVFDLADCVHAFVDRPVCTPGDPSCEWCDPDDPDADVDCGQGAHCDEATEQCARSCGLVYARDVDNPELSPLEVECFGALKTCNIERGRCVPLDISGLTCDVDQDCPSGAYCLLGECKARCDNSLDCESDDWYCAEGNRCRPLPPPVTDPGFVFIPEQYGVQLAQKSFELTDINNSADIDVLIMDLVTRQRVIGNPAVVFGYRVKIDYPVKQEPKCFGDLSQLSTEDREDCEIAPDEQWVTLGSTTGTISGGGEPTLGFALDPIAADKLSAGSYVASVTVFLSNGGRTRLNLQYKKRSLSGGYTGRVSVYVGGPDTPLGNSNVDMELFVDEGAPFLVWDDLVTAEGMEGSETFTDLNSGYPVVGVLRAAASPIFDQPSVITQDANIIPVKGIYDPDGGILRVVGVIDYNADNCVAEDGVCQPGDGAVLQVRNVFGRDIRRTFQFIGPFDPASRKYHGLYRETVSGLLPWDITLSGGFDIRQVSEAEPGAMAPAFGPLVTTPTPGFPTDEQLDGVIDDAFDLTCAPTIDEEATAGGAAPFTSAAGKFQSAATFASYINGDVDAGNRIFQQALTFEDRIAQAVNALDSVPQDASVLTIQDFLRGEIRFCDEDGLPQGLACVERDSLRCGLSLYQKALLSHVDLGSVPAGDPDVPGALFPLFCEEDDSSCLSDIAPVRALQEHNRFYKDLVQTFVYGAQGELSDAFNVVFRTAIGALNTEEAFSYKEDRLVDALRGLDDVRELTFSTLGSATFAAWPMGSFESQGQVLLDQMQEVQTQRMGVLAEYVDMKRRFFGDATAQNLVFVQHMIHEEWLTQVLLVGLQQQWQGEAAAYKGEGPRILREAAEIAFEIDGRRNPLGFRKQEVFFENTEPGLRSWEFYRKQIMQGPPGNGLLNDVRTDIVNAAGAMRDTLQDQQTFLEQIIANREALASTLDNICGEPTAEVDTCAALQASALTEGIDLASAVSVSSNPYGDGASIDYVCPEFENNAGNDTGSNFLDLTLGDDCLAPKTAFVDKAGALTGASGTLCTLDDLEPTYVDVGGGEQRLCVKGQVGSLRGQLNRLLLQREHILQNVGFFVEEIQLEADRVSKRVSATEAQITRLETFKAVSTTINAALKLANVTKDAAEDAAEAGDCLLIAGFSLGTNCPGKVFGKAFTITSGFAFGAVEATLETALAAAEAGIEVTDAEAAATGQFRDDVLAIQNAMGQIDGYVQEYATVQLDIIQVESEIAHQLYLAQEAASLSQRQTKTVVDHLIGNASGSALQRNQYVEQANARFRDLLDVAYRMLQAFIYEYNLDGGQQLFPTGDALRNQLFAAVSVSDVEAVIDELEAIQLTYCGVAGIDCDAANNQRIFRFSVRDQLFPYLTDQVDAQTGRVLTKGEQFHNLITSPVFLKRRTRSGTYESVPQVELPISIWLGDRGASLPPEQRFMVNPFECNHLLGRALNSPYDVGTIAVAVEGTRLDDLEYEMWRGDTDYLRACDAVNVTPPGGGIPVLDYPVNIYHSGYSPDSPISQQETVPSYVSHTSLLDACLYDSVDGAAGPTSDGLGEAGCFKAFARDRSLGSPDWRLVIPIGFGTPNAWVLNEGVPLEDRAIIDDIVVYFRYRARPLSQ